MERDPSVFCIGEDIGIYGGAFKVTEGFIDHFGPSASSTRPSLSRPSWALPSARRSPACVRWRNSSSWTSSDAPSTRSSTWWPKAHYRWGAPAPLVVRGPSGGGVHGGPFHSQNPEMYFVHTPGLKVVCPATAYDAKGLIKSAIRDNNPVHLLRAQVSLSTHQGRDVPKTTSPSRSAKRASRAKDAHLSVITYAAMVYTALEAAEILAKEGIELEIVDLRTLLPLDREAIADTVRKTNKVIVLHEHTKTGGIAGEVAAIINEEAFDDLDGPIVRIAVAGLRRFPSPRRRKSSFCPK